MDTSVCRKATLWVSIITLLYSLGCILSPEEESAPPIIDPIVFEDLTEKEHVIINLVNSYRALDSDEYLKLLLSPQHEKPSEYGGGSYSSAYFWYNQDNDVIEQGIEEYLDLVVDHNRTRNIFYAAKGTPIDPDKHQILDKLTLQIFDGTWTPADSLFGDECDDCWKTLREYDIWLWIQGEDLQIHGYDNIEFYIVPVQDGDKKTYRIATAYDILAN